MPPTTSKNIDYMIEKLDDVAAGVSLLASKFDALREQYQVEHVKVVGEATRAHGRIDKLEKDLDDLAKDVLEIAKLQPWVKGIAAITVLVLIPTLLSFLGAMVWFLWSLITHQLNLFSP